MADKVCILYIDDEPDIRLIVEMSLKIRPEIDVRTADGGEEALKLLASGDFWPDLVMVDVMMPGMSGPEVLAKLKADPKTAPLPVVFVTARAQPHDIADYISRGAKSVVTKPFDPVSLADQVLAILRS